MNADVIVIGGGIVGAACAHELARAGLDVLVLDARRGGATNAGMGHLVVMDDNPAELTLSMESLKIWHELAPRMNADCGFKAIGTLWLASNDAELAAAEEKQLRLEAHGVQCELLNAAKLAAAEPMLRAGLAGALKVGGDSVLYAPAAARWLLRQSLRPIAFEVAEVTDIRGTLVLLADGSWRSARAVVLAAGMQSTRFFPELPLRAKKGHLAITDRYPGMVHHQLVELGYMSSAHSSQGASVAFNVQPRPTGQLLIGSSRQFSATNEAVEAPVIASMLRCAQDYLPALGELNIIRTWAGFRCTTPDGLPLIGRHPKRDGLWLSVGHEGLGVTTAPATARLLSAQMTGATLPFEAASFCPGRFQEIS